LVGYLPILGSNTDRERVSKKLDRQRQRMYPLAKCPRNHVPQVFSSQRHFLQTCG
jgi:hypothetical protein